MKNTKRYLKILTMFIVMFAFLLSFVIAISLGITSIIGMFATEDLIGELSLILAAIIFGFITSILSDLMAWLDKKFKPYY